MHVGYTLLPLTEADAVHHELIYVNEVGFKIQKQGDAAEISSDTVSSSTSRDNMVATSQCVQLLVKTASFIIMQSQARTTLHT